MAHLLSGDAKKYHERITRELSGRFRIVPLHERVPPHLTLKIPFEADTEQIHDVEKVLRSFARVRRSAPLILKGFGRFGFKTIYLDVCKSDQAVSLSRECINVLRENFPWLPNAPLEGNKLHASVARFLSRRQFLRMWKLLHGLSPSFNSSFDNITILKKEDSHWSVHTRIALPEEHDLHDVELELRVARHKTLVS